MRMYTDSQDLWDALTILTPLTEKKLEIYIAGLRQVYRVGDLRQLCRIDSRYNPYERMSKKKTSTYLAEVLRTCKLSYQ